MGGVSGRPTRAFVRCRNGRRHPDPPGAGSLRGLPEERGSWSVRFACMGLVPTQAVAPTTTGALWMPRRGTSSACAKRTHSGQAGVQKGASETLRQRTRPSLGPETRARQSPLNSRGASRARWGGRFGIAVGQTCASGRNRHRGLVERTTARLAARHRFRCKSREVVRDASEKEGGHGHRPCEETRVPSSVLVRRNAVAEDRQAASWPRISSHAALQKE